MPGWIEIPCAIRLDGEVPIAIRFMCPCGAYWMLDLPLVEPQPYRVNCNCGREFLGFEFPYLARVWEILEKKEE